MSEAKQKQLEAKLKLAVAAEQKQLEAKLKLAVAAERKAFTLLEKVEAFALKAEDAVKAIRSKLNDLDNG